MRTSSSQNEIGMKERRRSTVNTKPKKETRRTTEREKGFRKNIPLVTESSSPFQKQRVLCCAVLFLAYSFNSYKSSSSPPPRPLRTRRLSRQPENAFSHSSWSPLSCRKNEDRKTLVRPERREFQEEREKRGYSGWRGAHFHTVMINYFTRRNINVLCKPCITTHSQPAWETRRGNCTVHDASKFLLYRPGIKIVDCFQHHYCVSKTTTPAPASRASVE